MFRCLMIGTTICIYHANKIWLVIPSSAKGRGGTPYNGLYGEVPPERDTFFKLQVYERVGIFLVEVYEREVGHLGLWKGPKG